MKKLFAIIGLALLAGVINLEAQTPPPDVSTNSAYQSFYATAFSWATSINTNLNWPDSVQLWTGSRYQSGINFAASLGGNFQLWKPTSNTVVSIEGEIDNASVLGTVVSSQGGLMYQFRKYDYAVGGYADGGYDMEASRPYFEFGLDLRKLMTQNSFLMNRIGLQPNISRIPIVFVGIGFTL